MKQSKQPLKTYQRPREQKPQPTNKEIRRQMGADMLQLTKRMY